MSAPKVTRLNKSDQFLGAAIALSGTSVYEAIGDPSWLEYAVATVLCFAWGFRHYLKATRP